MKAQVGFVRFPIEAKGLRDFQRELRAIDSSRFGDQLRAVFADVTDLMVVRTQAAAGARLRKAITPAETARAARIRLRRNPPDALARFFGAKRRTGWFLLMYSQVATYISVAEADARFPKRQFADWVGNQWEPGATNGVPYFVGPAVNETVPDAIDLLNDGLGKIFDRAFPD